MAYFVPDPQTIEVLEAVAGRGVDVQLLLPGCPDFWAVFHAGRSHDARPLAAAVRIHERRAKERLALMLEYWLQAARPDRVGRGYNPQLACIWWLP